MNHVDFTVYFPPVYEVTKFGTITTSGHTEKNSIDIDELRKDTSSISIAVDQMGYDLEGVMFWADDHLASNTVEKIEVVVKYNI